MGLRFDFAALDEAAFVEEVRKRRSKPAGKLTPAALRALREGYAEQAAPVQQRQAEALQLERRLAAWLVSFAAFAAHLAYEHSQLRNSALRAALHTSLAVALGAFALAVWILIHARLNASTNQSPLAPLALVVFPALTGAPAFLVAFVALTLLTRIRRRGR